ncbi:MAG TPA: cytochrome b [Stellaceae bacterium]|nr:cytochrome b [Stellaceae bacterium]
MPVTQLRYGTTAKLFHWIVVALIAVQLPLGWLMPDIRRGMEPGTAMSAHISIGITILGLIVARFLWRLTHPVAPESHLPAWQRVSAEFVHWLLYLAVLVTTMTGWFFESARGWTIDLYGAIRLPRLVEAGSSIGQAIGRWHSTAVWVLIVLVSIHVAAAFLHLFVYRDGVMARMLPG